MGTITAARAALTLLFLASALLSACQRAEEGEPTAEEGAAATRAPAVVASHTPAATATVAADRPQTVTPAHTPTAVPSPTPAARPLPDVQEAVPGALPPITHDLTFMDGDSLKVWRSESGQVEELARPVSGYEVAADGETILILQPAGGDDTGTDLLLLDAGGEGQGRALATIEDDVVDVALSPDGQRVAYVTGEAGPEGSEGRPAEPIVLLDTAPGAGPVVIGTCATTMNAGDRVLNYIHPCGPLVWTTDGQAILWGDGAGVWRAVPGESPVLLASNDVYEDDAPRLYRPTPAWSPDGGYLLLEAFRGEGSNLHVFDVETGQLTAIPHSTSGLGEVAYWIWAEDNGLFTVHAPQPFAGETAAVAELWEMAGSSLLRRASVSLPGGETARPTEPAHFGGGRFGFVLSGGEGAPETTGLYILASFEEEARRAAPLPHYAGISPPFGQSVAWAPDGSGAVVSQVDPGTGATLSVLYASAADGTVYTLWPALGDNVHSFSWLP